MLGQIGQEHEPLGKGGDFAVAKISNEIDQQKAVGARQDFKASGDNGLELLTAKCGEVWCSPGWDETPHQPGLET